MNILITGASGLIGTAIIKKLQSQDHKIYALSRSNKKSDSKIKWIKHDLYHDPISSLILPIRPPSLIATISDSLTPDFSIQETIWLLLF